MKCKRCSVDEDRIDGYCSEHCKEMAEAESRIAELEAERRWIPVSERLPELDQDVLAIVDDNVAVGHFYDDQYHPICFSTDDDCLLVATHWMPLPELPEVQE